MVLIISPLSATENEESEISDEEDDDDVSEEEMPSVKPAKKKQI